MRNTIKRIVTLLLVAMMALAVLTACSKTCADCGEKATETHKIDGKKMHFCENCYETASKCEFCGKASEKIYKDDDLGSGYLCQDCYDGMKALENLFS